MQEKPPPRRIVLRGALAAGCSLWVPVVFAGSDATPGANTAAPATAKKVPQASVHYQTQAKGDQKCSRCLHFIATSNTCKRVEGQISPDGGCALWAKKG